jgi:hypothetical protein
VHLRHARAHTLVGVKISIFLDDEQAEALERRAEQEHRRMGAQALVIILEDLKAHGLLKQERETVAA